MNTYEIFASSIVASVGIGALIGGFITAMRLELRTIGPMRQQVAKYRFDAIQASEHLKQVKKELGATRLANLKAGAPSSTIDLFDNENWSKRADLRVVGPKRNRAV